MGCSPSRHRVQPTEQQQLQYGVPKDFEALQSQVELLSSRVTSLEQQVKQHGAGAGSGNGNGNGKHKKISRSATRAMMESSNRVSGQGELERATFLKDKVSPRRLASCHRWLTLRCSCPCCWPLCRETPNSTLTPRHCRVSSPVAAVRR